MKPRIHILTLGVKDIHRSRQFYEGLGFRASSASRGDIVFLRAEGMVLALYPRHLLGQDAGIDRAGSGFGGVTFAHNVVDREDVALTLEEAEAAGGKIVKPAKDAFWGGCSGYFADPDGHLWEVAWNPHFPFAKDGSLELP